MSDIPADAQYSDDGQYWWDGTEWQPVGGEGGESGISWSFDWSQYPALGRLMQNQGDTNAVLAQLGVNTDELDAQAEA